MKLKLLTVVASTFLLTIPKAYAFESVISLGAGGNYTKMNLVQDITQKYTDPMTRQTAFADISRTLSNDGFGPNINFEYQARFQYISLGAGINNSNTAFESTYNGDINNGNVNIKLNGNFLDTYLLLLANLVKTEKFGLAIGASVGIGYFKTDTKDGSSINSGTNIEQVYLTPKFVVDSEYNINKHFAIFSRFSVVPLTLFKDVKYNTNLQTQDDQTHNTGMGIVPADIVKNTIRSGTATSLGLDFGIRYKF